MAEIQEGLELLAENEPNANLSFSYSSLTVNISGYVPWEGANWPGLPETFYRGFDAGSGATRTTRSISSRAANICGSIPAMAGTSIRGIGNS